MWQYTLFKDLDQVSVVIAEAFHECHIGLKWSYKIGALVQTTVNVIDEIHY
jgi:hypothetical protein